MLLRERVQVVALRRVQQVRGQHGIGQPVGRAHAVVGQHGQIVFEVLADQGQRIVRQQIPDRLDHHLAVQLRGVIRGMGDRDVPGAFFLHGQRHADEFGVDRLERRRFRVETEHPRGPDGLHDGRELGRRSDGFVPSCGRRGRGFLLGRPRRGTLGVEGVQQATEFERAEQFPQAAAVGLGHGQVVHGHG